MAHIGVGARAFSYLANGLDLPADPVRVELTAPDGSVWTWGPADAANRVSGPALDFCLLVTQRRHRDDTALVADGPLADQWLAIAQAFPSRGPLAAGAWRASLQGVSGERPGPHRQLLRLLRRPHRRSPRDGRGRTDRRPVR
ncbi:hypothetical protein [Mycobacteroides abscessus]|uniref:hypothetical protein n=1 Tax=Mycobacteroides abscessus TaxID=36809 RepID=UPI003B5116C3